MTTQRRLRLGMVGGGQGAFIGGVHRIAARLDDRYELAAGAFSSDPARARASAEALHVAPDRAYDSYLAMAKAEAARDDRIDVVSVVTPNDSHHAICRAFLDAGIAVICDKPITTSVEDALDLVRAVRQSGLLFAVTHNYTGYPMVRQARDMIAAGDLGAIRVVQVEYPQEWLTTRIEETGQKQAAWRTDPARSGPAGSVGDIGTHAHNLACFVTGLTLSEVAADLSTFVSGRALDDNAHMLLRFEGGARGMLWCSQVAPGNENGLRLRVYGERGGLEWAQEHPNQLRYAPHGEAPRILARGTGGLGPAAARATRIPSGHPEGYLEAFAQIYTDIAELLWAQREGRVPDPLATLVPGVEEGARGVKFIEAALQSSRNGAGWTSARLDLSQ
jgi:predicted dehydrogenase